MGSPAAGPVSALVTGFVGELREAGIPVSMVETIDAMRALRIVDLADRDGLRYALASTLVKAERHLAAFDIVFDTYFALAPGSEERDEELASAGTGEAAGGSGGDLEALQRALLDALATMDDEALAAGAAVAVERYSGFERGRPVGGTYYLYRTLRRLGLEQLQQMLAEILAAGEETDLDRRLLADEVAYRIERLREAIRDDIRRRLVADRGRQAVARTLRRPLTEDVDLMHANRADLDAIEDAIEPLTRKLAARLARRRRLRSRGRLDFRRTVRRSLATGGVPLDPKFRLVRPHRPEVFLLCDISGSMATFARFTLQFTFAMATQFSKLRSFAFIDTVDEISDFFRPGTDFATALGRVATEAQVVLHDGHSDYGTALAAFADRYGRDVSPRSTVIVTGDARNNYRPAQESLLAELAAQARAVYWLNPEPAGYWDTGDSVMGRYAPHCSGVFEVRTLRQLEAFVEQLTAVR